jgi:hypothetical protein
MSKAPSAIKLYKGLSLYRVERSTKWYVRVWDKKTKKYLVKSTGEDSVIRAREVAQELALSLLKSEKPVEREFTFSHFALKLLTSDLGYSTKQVSEAKVTSKHCIGLFRTRIGGCYGSLGIKT